MPQMKPMIWLMLLLLFLMIFMMLMIKIQFFYKKSIKNFL
uniref:ATP synthase FO subunit 8 n=1 Tax=Foenatopus ruficollis TaxID=1738635 RepID=A0A342I4E2_9HYME|nr:ATP synthase FO subunit 8 [Foenatopus ruficollis]